MANLVLMNSFALFLKEKIDGQDLNVTQLAHEVGMSRTYLADVLRGRFVPKEEKARRIAKCLGLDVKEALRNADQARSEIKASKPTRSSKFMEQRRAELLFPELEKRGLDPERGESPPLSVKMGKSKFAILFSQPNSDHRWTLGYSLKIKYDGYTKVFVLVEFQSEADKEYEKLFKKYDVILCNTDECLTLIEEEKDNAKR
jgi:transcriptional regulator with XRE-family HTH domain